MKSLLLTATLATGLVLVGSTSASAQNTENVTGGAELMSHIGKVRKPVFSEVRFTCWDGGEASIEAKLSNPNSTEQVYMVGIPFENLDLSYAVNLAPHGSEDVAFGPVPPNNTFPLQAQNAAGDVVALVRVHVKCAVSTPTATPTGTPTATPTGRPTATPTGTPTVSPSKTPTASPTTGTPTATTPAPSTPVALPTAVDAGLSGPIAPDDSNHSRTIVGAGLLAVSGIMIGLGLILVRRRHGLHQH